MLEIHPDKRPFIIGRSSFAGSGKYMGHWGGDNSADYMMYFSIPQALSMGLSGIPFFGVDACGFNGNTDMELCSRWMQLASFFPFYRNHNVLGAIPQEPYVWEGVMKATKTSINVRYSLLPYYYTLLHESHVTGIPYACFQLAIPYSKELAGVDTQFFVGDALLVTPVLEPGVNHTKGVFPGENAVYYDFYTHKKQNSLLARTKLWLLLWVTFHYTLKVVTSFQLKNQVILPLSQERIHLDCWLPWMLKVLLLVNCISMMVNP